MTVRTSSATAITAFLAVAVAACTPGDDLPWETTTTADPSTTTTGVDPTTTGVDPTTGDAPTTTGGESSSGETTGDPACGGGVVVGYPSFCLEILELCKAHSIPDASCVAVDSLCTGGLVLGDTDTDGEVVDDGAGNVEQTCPLLQDMCDGSNLSQDCDGLENQCECIALAYGAPADVQVPGCAHLVEVKGRGAQVERRVVVDAHACDRGSELVLQTLDFSTFVWTEVSLGAVRQCTAYGGELSGALNWSDWSEVAIGGPDDPTSQDGYLVQLLVDGVATDTAWMPDSVDPQLPEAPTVPARRTAAWKWSLAPGASDCSLLF